MRDGKGEDRNSHIRAIKRMMNAQNAKYNREDLTGNRR